MPASPRQQYEDATRTSLRVWEVRLGELGAEALELSGAHRERCLRVLDEARNCADAARICFHRLENARDGSYAALRETMDSLLTRLRTKVADGQAILRSPSDAG